MKKHASFSLPQDILIEIFLRLPLKSIPTCKLVSKEWKNLIKEPRFTYLYPLKFTAFFLSKFNLYCLFGTSDFDLYITPNEKSNNGNVLGRFNLLADLSNKIACVQSGKDHFDCFNPITGELFRIEDSPLREDSMFWMCYGFGYDCFADDYKLLLVVDNVGWIEEDEGHRFDLRSISINRKKNYKNRLVFVYSFRNRSWSLSPEAIHLPYVSPFWRAQGCYSNGAIHWVVAYDIRTKLVAAVDLHTCKLVEIMLPMEIAHDDKYNKPLMLTELDGELCCCSCKMWCFDVWVMKEYRVESSWIKMFSIDRRRLIDYIPVGWYISIVLYQRRVDGKIGIFIGQKDCLQLIWYDIAKDEIEVSNNTIWPNV